MAERRSTGKSSGGSKRSSSSASARPALDRRRLAEPQHLSAQQRIELGVRDQAQGRSEEGRPGSRAPADGAQGREDHGAHRVAPGQEGRRRGQDRRRVPRGAAQEPDRPDGDGAPHPPAHRGGARGGGRPRPHDLRRRPGARHEPCSSAGASRRTTCSRTSRGCSSAGAARSRAARRECGSGPVARSAERASRPPVRAAARCGRRRRRWRRRIAPGARREWARTSRSPLTTTSRRTRWSRASRGLTPAELRKVRDYERRNANRKTVLNSIESKLG